MNKKERIKENLRTLLTSGIVFIVVIFGMMINLSFMEYYLIHNESLLLIVLFGILLLLIILSIFIIMVIALGIGDTINLIVQIKKKNKITNKGPK